MTTTDGLGEALTSGTAVSKDVVVPVVTGGGRPEGPAKEKRPLYPRLLRLRHIHPNSWQRAVLGEGALAVAALLCLADLATLWTLLVLPLAVAAVVKAHDVVAGRLAAVDHAAAPLPPARRRVS